MAFRPTNATEIVKPKTEFVAMPIPDGGTQPARISLIVDLGVQTQQDFVDTKTGEVRPAGDPIVELAVFADLVDQVVDYGGEIGEAQYRIMINRNWLGEVKGFPFIGVPPRNGEGHAIAGKLKTFSSKNKLTEIAQATGCKHILGVTEEDNMNIEEILGKGLMVEVVVETKPDKNGKLNDKGEVIQYTNVHAKKLSGLPVIKKQLMEIEELSTKPLLVTFDNVTEETVKFLRKDVIRKIQQALNYPNSKMEALLGVVTPKAEKTAEAQAVADDVAGVEEEALVEAGDVVETDLEDFSDSLPF